MLRCKQVASSLADHYHGDLSWWKRAGMKLHVSLCVICGKYHRDTIELQDAVQVFLTREEQLNGRVDLKLSDEATQKLRESIKNGPKED